MPKGLILFGPWSACQKKDGAPNQSRSTGPRQGARSNSTWPAPRFRDAAQAAASIVQEPGRLRLAVSVEAVLDARASFKLYSWPPSGRYDLLFSSSLIRNVPPAKDPEATINLGSLEPDCNRPPSKIIWQATLPDVLRRCPLLRLGLRPSAVGGLERRHGTAEPTRIAPNWYNARMRIISLQSGSNGNSVYVEAGDLRLLFDAGLSGTLVRERLAQHGRDVSTVDAVLISHDHSDHSRSLGIYQRMFGLPVYVTPQTLDATQAKYHLGKLGEIRHFQAGATLRFGRVSVETIPTPHDGADGVVFVVDDGRHRLGILTDLGHVFSELPAVIGSLDAVLLESNYDPEMLIQGFYPEFLKERIQGLGGHISDIEAAALLLAAASSRLQWACLAHLSHDNNTPDLALETHRKILGNRLPLHVATRYGATDVLEL